MHLSLLAAPILMLYLQKKTRAYLGGANYMPHSEHRLQACLQMLVAAGNTKGGSMTVPLTSCLIGLELAV